ncbi:MAG: polysaccharide deacetylase family protein [Clostridiales bacterium]|nr:polysaccharide deacetylase family protein [Clostridiales bacterium]
MKVFYLNLKKRKYLAISLTIIFILVVYIIGAHSLVATGGLRAINPIYKGDESLQQTAFVCNVVGGTEYIPSMLNILQEHKVKISFFIGGEWARDNPQMLRLISEEGHELGNHGFEHRNHTNLDLDENLNEIKKTEYIIKDITGITTNLFSPPYGEFNNTTLKAASSIGYKTIMWSIDTINWRGDGVDAVIDRTVKNPHNGVFILIHPTEDTVVALPIIIKELKNRGYDIGTISELLSE